MLFMSFVFLSGPSKCNLGHLKIIVASQAVADPGGVRGLWPHSPVKISCKKDGSQKAAAEISCFSPPPPPSYCRDGPSTFET